MVCGLQKSDAWKLSLCGSVENGLHQAATDPQILHPGIHGDRANASDRRALVKEVAADNLAAGFSNNAEEPWM